MVNLCANSRGGDEPCALLTFSPDGSLVAALGKKEDREGVKGFAALWRVADGKLLWRFTKWLPVSKANQVNNRDARLLTHGQLLVTWSLDNKTGLLWRVKDGQLSQEVNLQTTSGVYGLRLASDGQWIAFKESGIRLRRMTGGMPRPHCTFWADAFLAFSPDSRFVAGFEQCVRRQVAVQLGALPVIEESLHTLQEHQTVNAACPPHAEVDFFGRGERQGCAGDQSSGVERGGDADAVQRAREGREAPRGDERTAPHPPDVFAHARAD